jgi:LysM repeat protein
MPAIDRNASALAHATAVSLTNWDYVWQPVKTRATASDPVIPPKPPKPVAPPPLPVIPVAAAKTYVVLSGDSLSRIAQKVYGNASQSPKI